MQHDVYETVVAENLKHAKSADDEANEEWRKTKKMDSPRSPPSIGR